MLSYALTRTFLVEAAYSYTRNDRSMVAEDADSNSIILWLIWQPTAR